VSAPALLGLAASAASLPRSAIREMGRLAARYPDAIRLEAGDPDFTTPEHIIAAAAGSARAGFTKYTPSAGLPTLREQIHEKVRARNGIECDVDQVIVTTGGCGGLFTSLACLIDPGDEVLVPDPGWANYRPIVHLVGGAVVGYPLLAAGGEAPDLDAVESRIGQRTKAILVNTPGNPTGAVLSRETLAGLAQIASRHGLWIVSDECYEEIVFEGEHVSMATLVDPERVVSVFSFSKSYAMTGWRVGYVVAPPALATVLGPVQEPVVGNAASVSQKAAEAALEGPQDCVATMRDAYRTRRDAAVTRLDAAGVGYMRPSGAFYLMVDVSPAGDSLGFASRLLQQQHVSVVPGSAFGPAGEGMVRISLSAQPALIEAGLDRLVHELLLTATL
jgi:aspartate/methionine/tyrosine aminotransferase